MGAWSHEPFGNDTACDWVYDLLETEDFSFIESALDAVMENGDEYLNSDVASEAIAAIEVIVKLLGKSTQTDGYTEEIDEWVKKHKQQPTQELLQKAQQVLNRIQSPESELLELWEEGEGGTEWKTTLQQLSTFLKT